MLRYNILPRHMQQDMKDYIEKGLSQGSFMRAIIANDFVHAAIRADHINMAALFDYARFLYDEAPSSCWGSYDIYNAWIRDGGLEGIRKDEKKN